MAVFNSTTDLDFASPSPVLSHFYQFIFIILPSFNFTRDSDDASVLSCLHLPPTARPWLTPQSCRLLRISGIDKTPNTRLAIEAGNSKPQPSLLTLSRKRSKQVKGKVSLTNGKKR